MRTALLSLILVSLSFYGKAQNEMCIKESQSISNTQMEGFSANMNAEKAKVEDQWLKYLKTFGSVNKKSSVTTLKGVVIGGFKESDVITATVKGNSANSKVWWGIEKSVENYDDKIKFLEVRLNYFIYQFLQQELQDQLKESERAAKFTGKTYHNLIRENNKIEKTLFKISKKQQKLEQQLRDLSSLAEDLSLQSEINQVKKEKTYEDLQKINKVLEHNKQKLSELAERMPNLKE